MFALKSAKMANFCQKDAFAASRFRKFWADFSDFFFKRVKDISDIS